ncbi:hypothetical protein ACIQ62_26560 [Streptomyces sp. NPDC096319]
MSAEDREVIDASYYALVIETSGNPRTLLASLDRDEVHQRVRSGQRGAFR